MILRGNGFYLLSLFQSCGSKNVEGRKMKKNLLLIGSENVVTQQYVDIHKNNYENIVGIDISDFSKLKLYKKVDYSTLNSIEEVLEYLNSIEFKFTDVVFTQEYLETSNLFDVKPTEFNSFISKNVQSFLFILQRINDFLESGASIIILLRREKRFPRQPLFDYELSRQNLEYLVKKISREYSLYFGNDIRLNLISFELQDLHSTFFLQRLNSNRLVNTNDITHILEFLLSEKSKAINGQIMHLN